ncbi:ABC transporter ATP-binding protein [Sphaerisporangium corydalis]|uniref:ABC transporter ATP-binding protein n=1 Tax=Sphaerisporangium corydalis TaxID=1441875 RepID=A0ABV9EJ53_9ACTN|nr:ATP-binding cassette domain-containing protein [Sphaerisporangium corydalis]
MSPSERLAARETDALSIRSVGMSFGSLSVLDGVSFGVAPGETLGLVGPNGAGKTTLLDIVAGARRCDGGQVLLSGRDVTRLAADRRCRLGLARTFQVPRPFGDLTVFENALVGAVRGAGLRGRAAYDDVRGALVLTDLLAVANAPASSLRLLDRKRLELARALAMRPRVLLLDEIAGGLTDPETAALVGTVRRVRDGGTAIVWVEHVLRALTQVATRLVCLSAGRVLAEGAPGEVLADLGVRAAYFGRSVL